MIKKITGFLVVLIILGVILWPKITPLLGNKATHSTNAENKESDIISVEGFKVSTSNLENTIFTTGSIIANEQVELSSEISGKITQIHFKEGQRVKKDDLLLKINDSELQAQLERVGYQLELAKIQEERQRKLLDKGGISQSEYDAAFNQLNVLQSEKKLIEAQIDKTEIRAPFSGLVGLKFVSDGSYISPSSQIASLLDINPVKIDFSVPERYYPSIEEGNPVYFSVQGSNKNYKGEIYAIEPKIDSETRTLQIRAISPNKNNELLPGAFADLELVLENIENALLIPTISLIPQIDGNHVFVYDNGEIRKQNVETGVRRERYIQITEGLSAGDTVLTTGLLQVKPGMKVRLDQLTEKVEMSLQ